METSYTRYAVEQIYHQLVLNSFVEEAIILHLVYSTGINLLSACLLQHSQYKDENSIVYWDYKASERKNAIIYRGLKDDLQYLYILQKNNDDIFPPCAKKDSEGNFIYGDFIFKVSASSFYYRLQKTLDKLGKNTKFSMKELAEKSSQEIQKCWKDKKYLKFSWR